MSRGGTKSTVGTVTEIWQFMRLLYAKLGQAYCPQCGVPVGKRSESEVVELVARELKKHGGLAVAGPPRQGTQGALRRPGRWAEGKGYEEMWVDGKLVPLSGFQPLDRYSSHDLDLVVARRRPPGRRKSLPGRFMPRWRWGKGSCRCSRPGSVRPELMGTRLACASCGQSFPELEPYTFSFNSPRGWCPVCRGHGIVGRGKVKEDQAQSLLEAELKYDGNWRGRRTMTME